MQWWYLYLSVLDVALDVALDVDIQKVASAVPSALDLTQVVAPLLETDSRLGLCGRPLQAHFWLAVITSMTSSL